MVTSLAEVWIEIIFSPPLFCTFQSLPLRKCGLKYYEIGTAADIDPSLPLRKCGLKFGINCRHHKWPLSLPLRKCGLKFPR